MNDGLDDLFRQELDGHASEPTPDLWTRLQARAAADAATPAEAYPVDARFRAGLAGYATPPRRELWERLEDEHLRPRQRRRPVVAWGRLAVAASLLLFVLAGGAGLWWNTRGPSGGPVAGTTAGRGQAASQPLGPAGAAAPVASAASGDAQLATVAARPTTNPAMAAGAMAAAKTDKTLGTSVTAEGISKQHLSQQPRTLGMALLASEGTSREKNRKVFSSQATGFGTSPSSSSAARTVAQRRPATAQRPVPNHPQPDAPADAQLALGGRKTSSDQLATQPETPALAAAPPQIIEVEVRRGSRPAATAAPVVVAAAPAPAEAAEPRRRLRLGGLLRQAGHALRGEQVSLAEATGLPEAVTVQAHLGDRVLSRTIRL